VFIFYLGIVFNSKISFILFLKTVKFKHPITNPFKRDTENYKKEIIEAI